VLAVIYKLLDKANQENNALLKQITRIGNKGFAAERSIVEKPIEKIQSRIEERISDIEGLEKHGFKVKKHTVHHTTIIHKLPMPQQTKPRAEKIENAMDILKKAGFKIKPPTKWKPPAKHHPAPQKATKEKFITSQKHTHTRKQVLSELKNVYKVHNDSRKHHKAKQDTHKQNMLSQLKEAYKWEKQ